MAERLFNPAVFPVVVAHRGASSTHPENTLASFAEALRLGAEVVELDLRLTSDGAPVVMHDEDVSRTTDGTGSLHELTFEQVRKLEGRGGGRVPVLSDVLELVSGRGGVALELKNVASRGVSSYGPDAIVEASIRELEATRFAGPVLFLSFDPRSIAAVKRLTPTLATGLLTTDAILPADALAHVLEAGHDFVLPSSGALLAAGEVFVTEAHERGARVGTWTVDDRPTLRLLFEWGVDAVASNDPATAVDVRREMGGPSC